MCRLFAESTKARGMLLVSCCWHALTNEGFPLSQHLKARGYRTECVSLMLATQPFDMWSSVSVEGHKGSAKLLFFRSLLPMLWKEAALQFEAEFEDSKCTCVATTTTAAAAAVNVGSMPVAAEECGEDSERRVFQADTYNVASMVHRDRFLALPHLEPPFLRRMAKIKDRVSLCEFAQEAFMEYYGTKEKRERFATFVQTNTALCPHCVALHERLFIGPACLVAQQAAVMEVSHMQEHFASFLGLTVLRMWTSHLVEALLLLDRALFLHETLRADCGGSDVVLAPLFDGALSPRMFGILAQRI